MNEQFYFPEGNIDHMMLTEGQNFDKRTFSKIDGSFYSYGNMKDIFYCGAGFTLAEVLQVPQDICVSKYN